MSEGEIWIKLFGPASLIISESFPLMWKFNVAELNFGNATCSISMSPATGSLLLCEEVLNLSLSWILEMPLALQYFYVTCHWFLVTLWRSTYLFTCTPGDRKGSCFLLVLGVSRVWCFDFAVASHKCCWPSKGGERLHLHSWRPQRFLFSSCPWCFTCLVFWFCCGFTQMLLAFQRGERLHTSLRTKTRIQPHISPLAEQTDRGSSLIKYQ